LTDELESRAQAYIEKIDGMGGAQAAIERGFIQDEIQNAAYEFQKAVERGEEIVVGVNAFQTDEQVDLERLKVDPEIEEKQRLRLSALRQRRSAARINELLGHLETAARGTDNLLPLFIECVENEVTLGELCGVLRRVWGEYEGPAWR
jgi:methylmalonyl-CoA mutase N-terminal domain/subunit